MTEANARYEGTYGDDTLVGTDEAEVLTTFAGNDLLRGRGGNDALDGGRGQDSLYGGKGDDYVNGAFGDDLIHGGRGNDFLDGKRGDDTLRGGRGDDKLFAGRGDDTLFGGKGNDSLWGNGGSDVFMFRNSAFGQDRVKDFDDGYDQFQFARHVTWEDLTIENDHGNAVITVAGYDESSVTVEGIGAHLLTEADFIFG